MLKDNFVDIYRAEENSTVKDVMEKYRDNKLELVTSPTHLLEESQVGDE